MKKLIVCLLLIAAEVASAQLQITNDIRPVIKNFRMNKPYGFSDFPTYISFDILNLQLGHGYYLQEPNYTLSYDVNGRRVFTMDLLSFHDIGTPAILLSGRITNFHFGATCSTNVFTNSYTTNICVCPPRDCNVINPDCFKTTNVFYFYTNISCYPPNNPALIIDGQPRWPANRVWRVRDLSASTNLTGNP
jgi:hypothetical protein